MAGGRRFVPVDIQKSIAENEAVYDWNKAWECRHSDYFRTDLRFGIKLNGKKTSQEWAVDLQNITNYKSIFMEEFDAKDKAISTIYQQGFLPMFLYRIQF